MNIDNIDPGKFIGCCGAYCKTCKPYRDGFCKGCRLGYEEGERDIKRAKCTIKLCCMVEREYPTCADCEEHSSCEKIYGRFGKEKYNFRKYMESLDYINKHGYSDFLKKAEKWKGTHGKLD